MEDWSWRINGISIEEQVKRINDLLKTKKNSLKIDFSTDKGEHNYIIASCAHPTPLLFNRDKEHGLYDSAYVFYSHTGRNQDTSAYELSAGDIEFIYAQLMAFVKEHPQWNAVYFAKRPLRGEWFQQYGMRAERAIHDNPRRYGYILLPELCRVTGTSEAFWRVQHTGPDNYISGACRCVDTLCIPLSTLKEMGYEL